MGCRAQETRITVGNGDIYGNMKLTTDHYIGLKVRAAKARGQDENQGLQWAVASFRYLFQATAANWMRPAARKKTRERRLIAWLFVAEFCTGASTTVTFLSWLLLMYVFPAVVNTG